MAKVMLINVTHAEESRVAIVADGTLVSFEIESCNREHLKGNIYKGLVQRVQPGLEAAFVDIGAERNAFLPLDEICFRHLPQPLRLATNGERRRPRIQELLKPGDELLVQIVKEQFGSKPPTLTTFYSLPGRFLVLLPGSDESGISRRIEGADRVRVRELIDKLHPPEGFGIIVRTVVGFDPGLADLQRDLTYLLRLWESIQQAAAQTKAPSLVYREHDLVLRNIRDYFTPDIDEIYVDNEEVFERARKFLRDVLPEKEGALRLYQGDKPIFSYFNIESQIESIYKRRVPLKSGGYIVIDGTEALTAIDVNSGRSVRGANQEETAFRTNLEAAVEIARQLRLRDLGGLIVIDFIDMRNPQHITEVEKALRTAMFEDKARHEVGRISHFGLLEVSRQRLRPAATATTYVTCPMCDGYGLVRTVESAALVALRKVHNRVAQADVGSLRVAVPADVALYLLNQKREDLAQLERRYNVKIVVAPKTDLMPHQCEIEVKPRAAVPAVDAGSGLRPGGVTLEVANAPMGSAGADGNIPTAIEGGGSTSEPRTDAVAEAPVIAASGSVGADATRQAKRRRRRGRRRGKGRLAAAAIQEGLSVFAAHVSAPLGEATDHFTEGKALQEAEESGEASRATEEAVESRADGFGFPATEEVVEHETSASAQVPSDAGAERIVAVGDETPEDLAVRGPISGSAEEEERAPLAADSSDDATSAGAEELTPPSEAAVDQPATSGRRRARKAPTKETRARRTTKKGERVTKVPRRTSPAGVETATGAPGKKTAGAKKGEEKKSSSRGRRKKQLVEHPEPDS
ncbi:MAG: Rne/Rng family ribonuclease [Candidatus Binatia bacterium]|nr:Rne/Rng family ribonuclease [Candidatus Binatia bacterium]